MSDGGKGAGQGAGGVGGGAEPIVMRRLLEEVPADPLTPRAWALSVLRRTPPHRAPVGRKQRVRLTLGQGGRRRTLPLLRPAIAGVILIGCGAAASAALGRWPEIVQAYRRLLAPASAPSATADGRPRRWASGQRSRSTSSGALAAPGEMPAAEPVVVPNAPAPSAVPAGAVPAPAEPSFVTAERVAAEGAIREDREALAPSASRAAVHGSNASWRPRRASARVATVAAKGAAHSTAKAPPPAAPAMATDAPDDTTPVLEAMRALRVEGNPARARRLLAGYLDRHPNGSLAEEALAMSIEAAVAHEDVDAPVLARKYMRRYPSGHFSAVARRTLDGAAGTTN
jgi:hypothetical protein